MRRHAPQWTSEIVIWEGMRWKIDAGFLAEARGGLGISVADLNPAKFSTYMLIADGEGRDAGGPFVWVRSPDMHVAIVRDHDTGDTDGYGRWV